MSNDRVELDRSVFTRILKLKALRIPPQRSSDIRSRVQDHLLSIKHLKSIRPDPYHSKKLVLLDTSIIDNLPEDIQQLTEEADVELIDYELSMGYENLTAVEVMKALLPDTIVIPTAFESIGHIAHLNLRPEHAPYRHALAQVLLDKNPSIRTVVNKIGSVENTYRLMELELLAGDASLETEVRQSNCRFRLDFGKVYWNSRLEFEHARLVQCFRSGEGILDLMAGIGPFAIPAAKAGCHVMANDKNPESVRYLKENTQLNNVDVVAFNLDARSCLRLVLGLEGDLRDHLTVHTEPPKNPKSKRKSCRWCPDVPFIFTHVIMNCPQYAIDFLDMFRGVFDRRYWSEEAMPIIHCYAFMHANENETIMKTKCETALGGHISHWRDFHIVRKVSPSKAMTCISFQLPYLLALAPADDRSHDLGEFEDVDGISPIEISSKKRRCHDG